MRSKWLLQLVEGTADPAFTVNSSGLISAWNKAAENLFGLTSDEAIARPCHEIIQGKTEAGLFCSERCSIQDALQANRPAANLDLQLQTKAGREWCNITIEIFTEPGSNARHSVHLVRPLEVEKLVDQLIRAAK